MSLQQWETYYRGGALATGPAGSDGLYDLEVRAAWEGFFALMPAQARLLDIGTGNGVLPLIALEVAAARAAQWQIDATDLARIDPPRFVADGARRFAGVRFHAGVASEQLPFEDACFDGVSGHYALEYSDTTRALAEVMRVLKPGGEAQFVLHHADSLLLGSARRSLADADLVFKQTKLYRRLHKLLTMEQNGGEALKRASDEVVAAIRSLRSAFEARRAAGDSAQILAVALDAAQKLLAARTQLRPEQVGLEVDRAEEELRTAARRLNDLVAHALDAEAAQRLRATAEATGFTGVELGLLHHNGDHLVGWLLSLRRPR